MKKYFKKIFATFLATITVAISISSISANATAILVDKIPENTVDFTDVCPDYRKDFDDSYRAIYHHIHHQGSDYDYDDVSIYFLGFYKFNYTTLYVTDNVGFIKLYNEYKADQIFEKYNETIVSESNSQYGEKLKVTLYDETDRNGNHSNNFSNYTNKRDEALKFCKLLQEKGYIAHATYSPFYAFGMRGIYCKNIVLENAVSGKSDEIKKTAEAFDSSIKVTERLSENSNISTYTIYSVEDLDVGVAMARELKSKYCYNLNDDGVYPSITIDTIAQESASSSSFQGSETDLTTAHYTGDIDNNETVDTSDIFDVMYYVARKGAGVENVSFTDGNAVEEAAAFAAADIDGNGKLDSTDVYYMMKYCAEKGAGLNPSWGD